MTAIIAAVFAAVLAAAASVPTAHPFPVSLPAAQAGAHCPDGGGRAIGEATGKGYVRQELVIVTRDAQQRVLGYVYSSSDGNDYLDLQPSDPSARVHLLQPGELPVAGMMRYCFNGPWTAPWGYSVRK